MSCLALLVAAAIALGGCGGGGGGGGETLTVATWKGYGADLPWVAEEFKKKTGASLKFVYIDSEQSLIENLERGGSSIDVALPNIQYIGQAIEKGLLHPLDERKLTNLPDVYPEFAELAELRKGGELFGLPWAWGSSSLFYSSKAFPSPPTSVSALWDPKYQGKIALFDDPTVLVPLTAMYLGEDPQKPDMSKVTPALVELKDNAKFLYNETGQLAKATANGSVVLGTGSSSNIGGLSASEQPDLKYTVPPNGGVGWIDNWAITAETNHLNLAYEWLNYMSSPEFLKKWAETPEYVSPAPANEKVVASLSKSARTRIQADPKIIPDLALQLPQPEEVLQEWVNAWQEAKAG